MSPDQQKRSTFVTWALMWTAITQLGGKLVNLLTTIVLAWLLVKEDFGLAGYAIVFVAFIEILEGFGVESALVYNDEDDELLNNAFWISALTGLGICLLVFLLAPWAAWLFDDERATPLVQGLSLAFFVTGLRIVPKALLSKRLQFKKLAIPEFTKAAFKAVIAISLALYGMGAWSLIWSIVAGLTAELVMLWYLVDWRPSFRFFPYRKKIAPLLTYGSGVMGMSIVGTLITNVDYVLVGRTLGAAALGVYILGFRLPTMLITPIIDSLSKVLFPLSSRQQSDREALIEAWKYSLRYIAIICIPIGVGIAAVSSALVPTIFGQKWIETVPVVSAIALQNVLIALAWHTGDIYKAIGRIKPLFWLGVMQLFFTAPSITFAVFYFGTVEAVAWAHVVAALLTVIMRLVDMSIVMRVPLLDIYNLLKHPLTAGALMAAAVMWLDYNLLTQNSPVWLRLILDILLGMVVYFIAAWLMMKKELLMVVQQLSLAFRRPI